MIIRTIHRAIFAASTVVALTVGAFAGTASADPAEDSPRFSCAVHGNHVCGPGAPGKAPAGFYVDGKMTVAWTDYVRPWRDPLNALGADDPNSGHVNVPTVDAYGRRLSTTPLAPADIPAWQPRRKMTDADVEDARRVAAIRFNPDGTPTGRFLPGAPAPLPHHAAAPAPVDRQSLCELAIAHGWVKPGRTCHA